MARRAALLGLLLAACPPARAAEDPAARLLEEGKALAAKKDPAGAYAAFAASLRAAATQDGKDAARDALLALPTPPAPPLTAKERAIVLARIEEERTRHLRDEANRLLSAGQLRGALRLLEEIHGALSEEATAKVIGNPDAAVRREREASDLRVRIFAALPAAERTEADGIWEKHRADPARVLREAARLRRDGRPLVARRVYAYLALDPGAPEAPRTQAREAVAALEKEILADLSPEERKAVDAALGSPVFGRLGAAGSREFVFIADADLLARIPERSRFVFDLAYLALTDLAGRVPNPDGDRVTVFFKELWDFPGAVGGGSRIDVGRADPRARQPAPVDTGLFFHELSHCVFEIEPHLPGWIEGVADFGAAFCLQFLRKEGPEWPSARRALEAFRRDYLDRDEPYWRMANYGPSAGWFLHWIEAYGARPGAGHDWVRYGRVFRGWAALPRRPDTVHGVARSVGGLLAREFGPRVWEDLRAHRFPMEEGSAWEPSLPDGPWAGGDAGVLRGWRVCGPFYASDPWDGPVTVFPPEREAVFDREYPGPQQVARWYPPGGGGPVEVDPDGTVDPRWEYPFWSVTYGLIEVDLPAAAEALAWVDVNGTWALWVDGRLAARQDWDSVEDGRGCPPDRDRLPLSLGKGRHRVLLKARIGGVSGVRFRVRITDREGRALPGLRCLPADARPFAAPGAAPGKSVLAEDLGRAAPRAPWRTGPGGFQSRARLLHGTETAQAVPWRKYSVRPGFPQDQPSNALSLDPKVLRKAGKDLRVSLAMEGRPKVALTLDSEEEDGGLTGWTVILNPAGDGADVRLERYDQLHYLAPGVALGKGREHALVVTRRDGFVSVLVDGVLALDRVSAPPLPQDGLRICTWGWDPGLSRIEIERLE